MKLTKGRLSKLYRKTNQSKRRIKKNKKRPVLRNTFRKRRPFDLNRKTLKRLRGGQGTEKEELEKRRKNLINSIEVAKKNLIDADEAAKKKYNKELDNAASAGQLGQTASLNAAEIVRGKKHAAAIGIIDNRITKLKYGSTGVKEDEDKKTERLEAARLEAERLEAEKKKAEEEAARLEAEEKQLEAEKEAARVNGIAVGDSTQNTPMQIAKGYAVDDTNDNEIISAVNVQGEPIKDTAQNEIQDVQNEYTRKIEEAGRELTQKLLAIAANKVTNVGTQDSMAATTAVANTMANVGITDNTSSNGNIQTTFPVSSAPPPPPM